jgi:hypothetical protein
MYQSAQEVRFADLAEFDVIITLIDNVFTPIKITRRTDHSVWYKVVEFVKLEYEYDVQVATYEKFESRYAEEKRLLRNLRYFSLRYFRLTFSPWGVEKFKHKANTLEYKWIVNEDEDDEKRDFVAEQPPNA